MKNIYLSYSWNDIRLADQLDILFKTKGIYPTRDVRDIEYKASIKSFMKKIRLSDFCLMIISNDYLKSINCMYEVLEFIKDDNYKDKVLPIIKNNANIFSAEGRSWYIRYWQDKYHLLDNKRAKINPLNQPDLILELKFLENIQRSIAEFLSKMADMHMIKIEEEISLNNFNELYNYINPEYLDESNIYDTNGYFVVNIPRTISEKTFVWWTSESKGYTLDFRNAKIFTENEIKEMFGAGKDNDRRLQWNRKKFLAVPIIDVALKLGSYIIPFVQYYKSKIENYRELLLGNIDMSLSEEEITEYI